jgi:hypothetical protein
LTIEIRSVPFEATAARASTALNRADFVAFRRSGRTRGASSVAASISKATGVAPAMAAKADWA